MYQRTLFTCPQNVLTAVASPVSHLLPRLRCFYKRSHLHISYTPPPPPLPPPPPRRCLDLLDEARGWGTELNTVTYNTAISACARGFRYEEALSLLREMPSVNIAPDARSYSAAISACTGSGRSAALALGLFREMESMGIERNERHYKYTLYACCEAQGGNWEAAVGLLREMVARGMAVNSFSYGRAMLACKRAGQWRVALDLLREMQTVSGLQPSPFCYDTVISAGCRSSNGGQWRVARELLTEQAKVGIPSLISYNYVISACKKAGRAKEAVGLLREMRRAGCSPDLISYNTAISACVKCRMWEKALLVLREMQWAGSGVDPDTYR